MVLGTAALSILPGLLGLAGYIVAIAVTFAVAAVLIVGALVIAVRREAKP